MNNFTSQKIAQTLIQTFGFNEFREGQEQTICQLLNGDSSLAIFPTGSGKSLCYQLAALHLPHLTLVVSPLLALMKDQLEFLHSKGISAASIDSSLTANEHQDVVKKVKSGTVKVLMVSVERFKNERFRQLISSIPVSLLVIDEAHCISEWGHNFRPDYLKLPYYQQLLNIPLVLLLTATATPKVKQDMAKKFTISEPHIVQTGFYRSNLQLSIRSVAQADKANVLSEILSQNTGAAIVYVTLQQTAEEVASLLERQGFSAKAYHAGLESELRTKIQTEFMHDKVQIIIATIAFGMGIDKNNVRTVVHYDLPKSIENYSQEIGRAGRDGLASDCITFAATAGLNTLENFIYGDTPELSGIEYVLQNIKNEQYNNQWQLQGLSLSTESNIRQLPLKTLLVQLELLNVVKPLFTYFADFKYKLNVSENEIIEQFSGERQDFLKAIFLTSHKKKVWAEPDFEKLMQFYQCDRARVVIALEYLSDKGLITLEAKKATEVFNVNLQALGNKNLAQQLFAYFKEKEQSEIARIHRLISFLQSSHCLTYELAQYFGDIEAPIHCGHCSVCDGNIITLAVDQIPSWPSDEVIVMSLEQLKRQLAGKTKADLSRVNYCRFLTGITAPMFARQKVQQLSGFALCEKMPFNQVYEKIAKLGF
ncbi:RecQ family ATP-dependent DNA helicase [Thalassotalea profundi]|uniref:ATP-dependent DNA helicase RecQ n=1 Tax=Thalassotalea profundi TaxID=2036687 RepID=A0ABQ3IK05_9GAMM|nr:RecQ family ATP-dependent DNA helicase [Thalassotalea profundi]GHE86131.1 ATP-dependent DNA helicase RecQ [Thalassotalea profundi]